MGAGGVMCQAFDPLATFLQTNKDGHSLGAVRNVFCVPSMAMKISHVPRILVY